MWLKVQEADCQQLLFGKRNRKEPEILMRAVLRITLTAGVLIALAGGPAPAQSSRRPLSNPAPVYPELARKMHLSGVVKVTLTIGADGQIKNAEFQGGHPVLIDAVQIALKDWKYAPASAETKILVGFKF